MELDHASIGRIRRANLIRVALNDLKRDAQTAACEAGVSAVAVGELLDPSRDVSQRDLLDLALALSQTYPLTLRDLIPIEDDAPTGVRIMTQRESTLTTRRFSRCGIEYYEYLDTAMTRAAMFRPELLRMLVNVNDNSADNPSVSWNNGHFLFQLTYFIGDVNYYHEFNGKRYCFEMNDGDAAIGMPYCRHSFTSRRTDGENAILALTFGGRLPGDPQQELSLLGPELAGRFVLDGSTPDASIASKIDFYRNRLSLTIEELAGRLNMTITELTSSLTDAATLSDCQLKHIADVLHVTPTALQPSPDVRGQIGVYIARQRDSPVWNFPGDAKPIYRVRELCGTKAVHGAVGLEMTLLDGTANADTDRKDYLEHGLHQYGYVVGADQMDLEWIHEGVSRRQRLNHGDSFYCKPFVKHRFVAPDNSRSGDRRVVLLRIPGKLGPDQLDEATTLGADAIQRLISDTTQWYSA